MEVILRMVHVLTLGLWFGAVTFFSFFTAIPIIDRMQNFASESGNWLRLEGKREGTRLAGEVLDPVFAQYFPLQVACGVVALLTALCWVSRPGTLPKVRVGAIAVALLLAVVNLLLLAPRVHRLRLDRYGSDVDLASRADAAFGMWHTFSLLTDMATLLLVTVALALAAVWPPRDAA